MSISMASTKPREHTPHGRKAVKEALLDAATDLFAAHGHNGVAMRDIAARARVNYGLMHRHFGSKQALLRAVLDRLVTRVNAGIGASDGDDLDTVLRQTLSSTAVHGDYFRILARAMLDGAGRDEIQTSFPVADKLVAAATAAGVDHPRDHVARQLATGLGWLVFGPYIRAATGVDGNTDTTA